MLNILQTIWNILTIISTLAIIPLLITFIAGIYLSFKGILPLLFGLGKGLATSKIAIFAKGDNLTSLKTLLKTSDLFSSKSFIEITNQGDFSRVKEADLYLVFWDDWNDDISYILNKKEDKIPLIVYAPPRSGNVLQDQRSIPKEKMLALSQEYNTIVTNFKGRLLNDIMISLITGSYSK